MSVRNPYKQKSPFTPEYKEEMSQNRSTLYHYFKDTGLEMRMLKIGKGTYKVFVVPFDWDNVYLIINGVRFTDFQSVILFTNELVVRYCSEYDDCQVNIPYRIIKTIKLDNELHIGFEELHLR